jgi:DNA-binding response OmpR family regulator
MERRFVVAVINSNEDIVELVRQVLEERGFQTVTAHIPDVRRGRTDLIDFFEREDPDVVVYDIGPPFQECWNFLRLILSSSAAAGRPFVLTTTNRRGLQEMIGHTNAIELLGKPYDLEQIVGAVQRASARIEPSEAESEGGSND